MVELARKAMKTGGLYHNLGCDSRHHREGAVLAGMGSRGQGITQALAKLFR